MRDYEKFATRLIECNFCPGFDESYYLIRYNDTFDVALCDYNSPLEHYLNIGWKRNLDPSVGFSGAAYFAANTDVFNKGVNPLVHYLLFGLKEGRSITAPPKRTQAIAAHLEAGKPPPFLE